jgi:hypothetical protein
VTGTILAAIVLVSVSVALYLVPVMVGVARHAPDLAAIAVINILLGWTFVGWVLALALAMRSASPSRPMVQLVQNLPPGGGWAELQGGHQPWQAPQLMLPEAPPDDTDETPTDWE